MATLILTIGAAALTQGAAAWVAAAATAAATVAGSYIDRQVFGPGPQKQQGPRLDNLQVQASTEGAPILEIAGRMRLSGQVFWATKFKEVAKTQSGSPNARWICCRCPTSTWCSRCRSGSPISLIRTKP